MTNARSANPAVHTAPSTQTDDPITIRWRTRWDETRVRRVALPVIRLFQAQHPDIRVELENVESGSEYYAQLRAELDAGEGPDVFYPATHVAYELHLQEQLLPLEELIAADQIDLAAYDADVLALYAQGATPYCLPADVAALAVIYNQELFADANVAAPPDQWTWDEFRATAQVLTVDRGSDEDRQFGVDDSTHFWPLLLWSQTGHNVFDDPYSPRQLLLDEPAALAALQWLADLANVDGVAPTRELQDDLEIDDFFRAGKAAMRIVGQWELTNYIIDADFAFGLAPLPRGEFAVNRIDGSCYAIAANSAQPAAAWEFVKFLAAPGGMGARLLASAQQNTPALRALQHLPAYLRPVGPGAADVRAFLAPTDLRLSFYDPLHPLFVDWREQVNKQLVDVWKGDDTADQEIGDIRKDADKLLAQMREERRQEEGADEPTPLSSLPMHYYVSPQGDDANAGFEAGAPFASIQHALDLVKPGDTIHLAPGDYMEDLITQAPGAPDAPITIMGPPDAVLRGKGDMSTALRVRHDYYALVGFTIDGLHGDPAAPDGYTEKLLYVQGETPHKGVTGLRVYNMAFHNAGGECVRLRYFAQHNEIAYSTFETCGLLDYTFDDGGKNGEAIYIGTSSKQWNDGKNATADPDESSYNWIHHNVMNTQGNECVDIKEGAYENIVEYNHCTGQLDPESGGLGARGDRNIFRFNVVEGNVGVGVRLGGHKVDGVQYGRENQVYDNQLIGNREGGIRVEVKEQGQICANSLRGNRGPDVLGELDEDDLDPTTPC
ncbi:MAG: extracellular solute-binding protein [Caldilineaceae bacterium]